MPQTNKRISASVAAAMITAPGSGQGKSLITAALARLHRNAGRRVRVFKFGPDFLDPMVLERASGHPVYQLHPWMTGEAECRWRLAEAAREADLILLEGAMGLFDGEPSSAELAVLAGIPAIPVIDAFGMAQTFGAVALGLARYRKDLEIRQLIANRVAGQIHADMLAESLGEGLELLGAVPQDAALSIPDRHLGILQAEEIDQLDAQLDAAAEVLQKAGLERLPARVTLSAEAPADVPKHLAGRRIAIARDRAFAFIYPANVDLLQAMGAELEFFSPQKDEAVPEHADALWLPGGYPELHAGTLSQARRFQDSLRQHHAGDRPILAECGGMMACMETLHDQGGMAHAMAGLLRGACAMSERLTGLGSQSLETRRGTLRGHTFHHSRLDSPARPVARTRRQRFDSAGEGVFLDRGLTASYFHSYFPSCPEATATLFQSGGQSLLPAGS